MAREKVHNDPVLMELSQRVSRLEADVAWLKRLSTTNVTISVVTFLSIVVMILKLAGW